MNPNVDLRKLAVRREAAPAVARRRHLLSRYLLPGIVALGFLALIAWAARENLLPAKPVTVVPVMTTRADTQESGTPLFQSAGWVEPRPTPTLVTALAEGVVDQLLVVEGQPVKTGEPVARLSDADARLALNATEADVRLRQSDLASARAALEAARVAFQQPVQQEAAVAEADAALAQKETEVTDLSYQLRTAASRLDLARDAHSANQKLSDSHLLADRLLRQTKIELDTATTAVEQLKARQLLFGEEVAAMKRKSLALHRRLELKTEETLRLAEAGANLQAAEARLQQVQAAAETARLRLSRMTVRSPVSGRVLALAARPGMRLMGLASGSFQEASTVVTLYDPNQLQVRADVRLEDLPRVQPGQQVRIETPAAGSGPLDGEVLFATSQADIQKNTLQVKVAIKSPPAVIKPDMLVRVTFLAQPSAQSKSTRAGHLRLLVPRPLVDSTGSGGAHVWLADQVAHVARLRSVELGPPTGDLVEVVEGLAAGDRLIAGGREGLADGQRIAVTGEDAGFGAGGGETESKPSRPQRIADGKGDTGPSGKH
jgi:RND family efflux transporter MFP subunit